MFRLPLAALAATVAFTLPAIAQEDGEVVKRTRITLGPEVKPAYPGADKMGFGPFVDVARSDGNDPFSYEAPDEGFGIPVIALDNVYVGPTLAITGSRKADDTVAGLREIDTTFEAGVAIQVDVSDRLYGFSEIRRGIGGHDAFTGQVGLDYIWRKGDDWLISLGPRVDWGDAKHQRAYFGVSDSESAASGIAAYRPSGGIYSAGGTLGGIVRLNERWGLAGYAGYRRLVGDAADSPVTRQFGTRDQYSGGIGLTYTFVKRAR